MPKSRNDIHVISALNGGWSVRKAGASRASKVFDAQNDAVRYARSEARKLGAELYVHGRDGSIRARDSYSSDPHPPKK